MVLHMLAVFGRETAHPPTLIESEAALKKTHTPVMTEEDQAAEEAVCKTIIEKVYDAAKPSTRNKQMLGKGSGFLWEVSPYCSYAERKGVHVLFSGEVSEWPGGVNAVNVNHDSFVRNEPPVEENDAHWLLDFYGTFGDASTESNKEKVLEWMASVKGSFAFVIFDEARHRVLAARDAEGTQPLYWGCTEGGQLMFGSAANDLEGCFPSSAPFPAGTLFASERHTVAYSPGDYGWVIVDDDVPGMIMSFMKDRSGKGKKEPAWRSVRAIPRVTSKGIMCGAVFKVASEQNMDAGEAA